jgi:hypothetical protein
MTSKEQKTGAHIVSAARGESKVRELNTHKTVLVLPLSQERAMKASAARSLDSFTAPNIATAAKTAAPVGEYELKDTPLGGARADGQNTTVRARMTYGGQDPAAIIEDFDASMVVAKLAVADQSGIVGRPLLRQRLQGAVAEALLRGLTKQAALERVATPEKRRALAEALDAEIRRIEELAQDYAAKRAIKDAGGG